MALRRLFSQPICFAAVTLFVGMPISPILPIDMVAVATFLERSQNESSPNQFLP